MPCRRGDRSRRFRLHLQRTPLLHAGRPSRSYHAGQPPRCGQLLHGPAHADTRRRAVVPQRCPRLSDIHRKPLTGYVLVPHPARRQASRRGEKSQVWLSRPPYMFFPFSSPMDLEELVCRRSQELRTSDRLKIRRCSRSWLNYDSPIVLEVSILVLIRQCRSVAFLLSFGVVLSCDLKPDASGCTRVAAMTYNPLFRPFSKSCV